MTVEWKRTSESTERAEHKGYLLFVITRRKVAKSPSLVFWEVRKGAQIVGYGNTREVESSQKAALSKVEELEAKENVNGTNRATDWE